MQVIRTAAEMREARRGISGSVALVATLGGIHAGHTAHMDTVRPLCDTVVGSLFLNPTQFGPDEDLSTYPADEAADLAEFEKHGVDIVFAPSVDEMYPPATTEVPQIDPGPVASVLEGVHRPVISTALLRSSRDSSRSSLPTWQPSGRKTPSNCESFST